MRAGKIVAISVLVISGSTVFLILTMPLWGGWLLQRSMRETYEAISKVALPCKESTMQVIEPWGKSGYSVSCRRNGVKDGPWQAWEGGHIHNSGFYAKGKEHGTWLIYSLEGNRLYRTITYENGKEVANVVH